MVSSHFYNSLQLHDMIVYFMFNNIKSLKVQNKRLS